MSFGALKTAALAFSLAGNVVLAGLCADANLRAMGFASWEEAFGDVIPAPDVEAADQSQELAHLKPGLVNAIRHGFDCYEVACHVSLSQLLARPDIFRGVPVLTAGWVRSRRGPPVLVPYREDLERPTRDVLVLALAGDQEEFFRTVDGQFVDVLGTYSLPASRTIFTPGELSVSSAFYKGGHRWWPAQR